MRDKALVCAALLLCSLKGDMDMLFLFQTFFVFVILFLF